MTNLLPPPGQQHVQPAPGSRHTGRILLVAVKVDIAGKQQNGREEHGQWLEWAHVLGRDERREKRRWQGIVCFNCIRLLALVVL